MLVVNIFMSFKRVTQRACNLSISSPSAVAHLSDNLRLGSSLYKSERVRKKEGENAKLPKEGDKGNDTVTQNRSQKQTQSRPKPSR